MMTQWEVMRALPDHIQPIAAAMRDADRREVWAYSRHTPAGALEAALERSDLAWTCAVDGVPAFMWGAARMGSLIAVKGAPWLLGTDKILAVQREFLRQCPAFVERMQRRFPRLENYVHAENRRALRWLRWCGFTVEESTTVFNGEPFRFFWRDAACVL